MDHQMCSKKKKVPKSEIFNDDLDFIIPKSKKTKKNELYLFSCEMLSLENIVSSTKPNYLQTLVVIRQTSITSLNGISELINLRELWIIECHLKDLSELQECRKLERVYLYSNNISQIPNMSNSFELKLLSLSGNNISHLKNLESMPKLQELYISNNRIKKIGNAFWNNSHLSLINLAGNPLYELKILASKDVGERSKELLFHEMLQQIYCRIDANDDFDKRWVNNSKINLQILQRQLSLKVQHCGNMDFVEYLPSAENKLLKICQDICNDSLCRTIREDLGISSVNIHRVTKVINNEADAFRSSTYYNENINQNQSSSDFGFMFLVGPVGVVELQKWPFDIFEEEFFNLTEITTSHCLAAADSEWIKKISLIQRSQTNPLSSLSQHRIAILVQLPVSAPTARVERPDDYHAMYPSYDKETCQCFSIVRPEQVKPVFAVEYEYVFENGSEKGIFNEEFCEEVNSINSLGPWPCLQNLENLSFFLNLKEPEVLNLQVIDLSGQGIRTFDITNSLPNLRELSISFNKLTTLPALAVLKYLRKLDVSFNNIKSFEITTCLPLLENFDAAWNLATEFVPILQMLKTFSPNLVTLNFKYNPFVDVTHKESMFLLAQNDLPMMKYFNDITIQNSSYSRSDNQYPRIIDIFEKADPVKLKVLTHSASVVISETNRSLTSPFSAVGIDLKSVQYINLSHNHMSSTEFVTKFSELREFNLENNLFLKIVIDEPMNQLTKLSLRNNFILTLDGLTHKNLPVLDYLDLCNNLITSLIAMGTFHSLTQFYCSHNNISEIREIHNLKNWHGLKIIDISNNPIDLISQCNNFIIFHVPKIEYVGGRCVTASDVLEASHAFGGFLDKDRIMNMCNPGNLTQLKQLSIVNCMIKKVNLTADLLPNLKSLDLSQNHITSLWGLHTLNKLQDLCLSHNQVETSALNFHKDSLMSECVFPSLKTLFLDHNGIRSLVDLDLHDIMPELKYLYVQHNELQDVNGLQKCANLEILVLDYNRIQMITEEDFHTENNIKFLFLENNKIKYFSFARRLRKIEKLFLSNNKVTDKDQLKYLDKLQHLKEITIIGNPFCKRTNHFKLAIQAIVTLTHIDGHSVISKEYFDNQ